MNILCSRSKGRLPKKQGQLNDYGLLNSQFASYFAPLKGRTEQTDASAKIYQLRP